MIKFRIFKQRLSYYCLLYTSYCNIDEGVLAKLDVESEVLEESMTCTFSDFEYLNYFSSPNPEI